MWRYNRCTHQVGEGDVRALERKEQPGQPAAPCAQLQDSFALQLSPRVQLRVSLHVADQDHAGVPDRGAEVVRRRFLGFVYGTCPARDEKNKAGSGGRGGGRYVVIFVTFRT